MSLNFCVIAAISIVIIITTFPACTKGEFHTLDSIHTFISHFKAVDAQLRSEVKWLRIHIYMVIFRNDSILAMLYERSFASLSDNFEAMICTFLKTTQDQLYQSICNVLRLKNCQNKSVMETCVPTCVILGEVCDESLLFNSCYTARMHWRELCPQCQVTAKVLQASKQMQIIFLPVFPTMSPKPLCVTVFASTSWLICNLKCDYETHIHLALLSGMVPRSTGRGDRRERGVNHS